VYSIMERLEMIESEDPDYVVYTVHASALKL
jgi:hypothetical protein